MRSFAALSIVSLSLVLTCPGVGFADNTEAFQNELGFAYGHTSDSDDTFDTTILQFEAVHFLQPVDTANHPLAEAAFLEHAASIGFLYMQSTTDYTDGFLPTNVDRTMYAVQFDYASTTSPLTFSAVYAGMTLAVDEFNVDLSGNQALFKLGSYISGSGRVQGIVSQLDFEGDSTTIIGVDAKFVNDIGNDMALGIDGMYYSREGDSSNGSNQGRGYTIGVDLYPSRMTNIGFTRDWSTYKDPDGSFDYWTHHFRIKHFLSPQASIAFEYLTTDKDSATDGFNIKISLRI